MDQRLVEKGRKFVNDLLQEMGSVPISDTWKTRPASNLILFMCEEAGVGYSKLAEYLGCATVNALRNKVSRGSFDIKDLMITAHVCHFDLCLKNQESNQIYTANFEDYIKTLSDEERERIRQLDERDVKREAYEAELEKLKRKYGIKD